MGVKFVRTMTAWALALALLPCAATAQTVDESALVDDSEDEPYTQTVAEDGGDLLVQSDVEDATHEGETIIEQNGRPEFVDWLLEVAAGELGYTEGANNYSKYGEWSGDPNAAWCAEFVCWCVDQVDKRHDTQLLTYTYPNYGGQNTGRDWFIKRGRFVYRRGNCPNWGYQWLRGADHLMTKNEYIPRAGDFMFFSYNQAGDTEHVALVEYCAYDAQGRVVVHVIEGNNPSSVQRNSYYLASSQVLGFGTCEDVADTTIRSGCSGDKVRVLQERLNRLGFLADKDVTGSYGGNTRAAVAAYQQTIPDKTVTGIADRQTQQAIEAEINQLDFDNPDTWLVSE